STRTTSTVGSHRRMYFGAVAPPKPPPTTTTRAFEGVVLAQPTSDVAAAILRNSRLLIASPLQCREPGREHVDLRVRVALRDLVHERGRPLAVAEGAHLRRDVIARQPGERDHLLGDGPTVGAVADGTGRGQVARVFLGMRREGGGACHRKDDASIHEPLPVGLRK